MFSLLFLVVGSFENQRIDIRKSLNVSQYQMVDYNSDHPILDPEVVHKDEVEITPGKMNKLFRNNTKKK